MNVIIFFPTSVDPMFGGVERMSHTLASMLEMYHHKVFFVCWRKTSEIEGVFYLPNKEQIDCVQNTNYLKSFCEDNKIQVFIDQGAVIASIPGVGMDVRKLGVKYVPVFHNSLFGMYGRSLALPQKLFYKTAIRNFWYSKTVSNMLCYLFRCKYRKHYQLLRKNSDAIVLLSDKYREEIDFFCGTQQLPKIVSLPNPCAFTMNNENYIKEKSIMFCGRLNKQKRPEFLLEIWNKLYAKYPDWNLIIVGDGELRLALEKYVQHNKLERVTFAGTCSPLAYYEKASIFALTSVYEGWCLVLFEAMNFGVIPVSFESFASVSDIITDGKDGMIVKAFSINEYVKTLEFLMNHPEMRNRMSEAGKSKLQNYTKEYMASLWNKLLIEL